MALRAARPCWRPHRSSRTRLAAAGGGGGGARQLDAVGGLPGAPSRPTEGAFAWRRDGRGLLAREHVTDAELCAVRAAGEEVDAVSATRFASRRFACSVDVPPDPERGVAAVVRARVGGSGVSRHVTLASAGLRMYSNLLPEAVVAGDEVLVTIEHDNLRASHADGTGMPRITPLEDLPDRNRVGGLVKWRSGAGRPELAARLVFTLTGRPQPVRDEVDLRGSYVWRLNEEGLLVRDRVLDDAEIEEIKSSGRDVRTVKWTHERERVAKARMETAPDPSSGIIGSYRCTVNSDRRNRRRYVDIPPTKARLLDILLPAGAVEGAQVLVTMEGDDAIKISLANRIEETRLEGENTPVVTPLVDLLRPGSGLWNTSSSHGKPELAARIAHVLTGKPQPILEEPGDWSGVYAWCFQDGGVVRKRILDEAEAERLRTKVTADVINVRQSANNTTCCLVEEAPDPESGAVGTFRCKAGGKRVRVNISAARVALTAALLPEGTEAGTEVLVTLDGPNLRVERADGEGEVRMTPLSSLARPGVLERHNSTKATKEILAARIVHMLTGKPVPVEGLEDFCEV